MFYINSMYACLYEYIYIYIYMYVCIGMNIDILCMYIMYAYNISQCYIVHIIVCVSYVYVIYHNVYTIHITEFPFPQ